MKRLSAAMAHNDHDGTSDVRGVHADKLPGRLYWHALHGRNWRVASRLLAQPTKIRPRRLTQRTWPSMTRSRSS